MTVSRTSVRIGESVGGRYRLERELGSGNVGTVFRALDLTAQRPVAVKVLHDVHTQSAPIVTRFLREAKAAALVRHPYVVEVLDSGMDTRGTLFVVQELLEGRTLAQHLDEVGRLPVGEALRILSPVVEAMAHAHAQGVIHRDLNPSNIFLCAARGGGPSTPKVLDFGISKITVDDVPTMSASGISMGTPAYMPPEQVKSSRSVDVRADVWSIGVILFEMLSGRLPFLESETTSMFVAICTSTAPRLDTVARGVPEPIVALVERCLRPKREERPADAGAVLEALRQASAGLTEADRDGADAARARPSRSLRWVGLALAVLAVALLALAVIAGRSR